MRRNCGCVCVVLLLIGFMARESRGRDGHAATAESTPASTSGKSSGASAPAEEPAGILEHQIRSLREKLALESNDIQAQIASLQAEQAQLDDLEKALNLVSGAVPGSQPAPATSAGAAAPSARSTEPSKTDQAAVLPAIIPIRTLPVGGLPREAFKPAFDIGSVGVLPYGFLKATFIHDSSSPNGDDFPLPGFLGDSGPTASPEFHIKARSSRLGTRLEWLDPSSKLSVTGKFEMDFEGNFSRADNRNLSSIRSGMPSIRLAYARLDYRATSHDTFSALFGQDWTPFASSTLPSILETTGLGIGFGVLWERDPQMRFGWTHNFGGFQVMPEVALVLPASGDTPAAANLVDQLGYGERQGADSDRPSLQARLVFQWQLDHAPGVPPAQVIFSAENGSREAIVLGSAVPAAYQTAFARGATVSSKTDGWATEWQLPTRYATLIGKYYGGSDLRWFFAGQLFSNFNDILGLTGVASASSIDGASTVDFGLRNGIPVVAPQRPVRAAGGFFSLGLPISRIFGADPQGRNAGWSVYFTYGTDEAKARDLLRLEPAGSRARSDMSVGTVYYKLNKWVTFAFEQSLYRTRANTEASGYPLFMGMPQHEWKDIRSEGGTIFSF
jgi:hypothetical protein